MPRGSRTSDPLPRGLAIEETIGGSGAHGRPTTGFSSFGGDSPPRRFRHCSQCGRWM